MTARPAAAASRGFVALAAAVPLLVCAFHWRAAAPGQAFVGSDLRNFFFAIHDAVAEALRAGRAPGWQRGIFLGYPLAGDPQAAWLDPAVWLTLPWDGPRALTLATLLHLCAGGWGMALWMRVRGLSAAAAALAAVLFALGAKQTVHLQHWNFAASMAWWPFMLAGLDGFAAAATPGAGVGPAPRGRGRWLAVTSVAAALSWAGGAAQMAYFGTLVASAHALALAPRLARRRPADALLALAAAPAGLLLAGPVVLPVVELARLGPRGAGVAYAFATSWKWPSGWGLALLVLPRAYGGAWVMPEMNLWEATGYLGILPLALAAAAPLRRRALWVHAALAVAGVWLCFGEDSWLGVHRLAWKLLPGYGSFRNPTRSLMVTGFSCALLAAEGLDALRADPAWRRRALRAGSVLGALAVAAALLPRVPAFPLDREAARATAPVAIALALAGLGWLAAASAAPRLRARAGWPLAATAIALADLWLAFGRMNPVAPASGERPPLADLPPLLPRPPAARRVAVVAKWGQSANAALRLGFEGATGYSPSAIARVRALLEATRDDVVRPPAPVSGDTNFPRPRPTSALWPLFAAPVVVTDDPVDLPAVATLAREWERPLVVHRAEALPRAYWLPLSYGDARADDVATGALLEAAEGRAVVLGEEDAGLVEASARGGGDERDRDGRRAPAAVAAAVRVGRDRTDVTVDAPRGGWLVVLDPWFPGWTATVDGSPARLHRANFAFMALLVPRGVHAVRLEYRNAQVGRGALVSVAIAALLAGGLAARRRASRRGRGAYDAPHP